MEISRSDFLYVEKKMEFQNVNKDGRLTSQDGRQTNSPLKKVASENEAKKCAPAGGKGACDTPSTLGVQFTWGLGAFRSLAPLAYLNEF
ncbi:MAG: hypothetical protein C0613_12420 [Desulfobulbaceae bacterium]|nr:MAG: hypothetical protein C0613_12420 [Desulfobulbaceae bacterium]